MGAAATEGQTKEEGGRTAGITAMGLRPARKQGRATGLRPARKGRATGLRRAWKGELLSFVGRVLFASTFLLSVYQEATEFGDDGGPAAKFLEPKFNRFVKQVSTYTGMAVPHVEIKTVVAVTIHLRAGGALLFIFYSSIGSFLLIVYLAFITPIVHDFYNYKRGSPQCVLLCIEFSQNLALYGALLFFWAMKRSIEGR
ncbi:uncharacterized protein LOC124661954 [Lolium rigidum]|uniref:uncharacterized protein LOC124661954 n=1 Tax=Lolium rigidum TaxID=89674 RepID=UPI001F5D4517|nr:uncharacterized protein LOC124661954 [Lolium rigidum]